MAIRSIVPCLLGVLAGLGLGWWAASYSTPTVRAGQGDRSGESILATGPILLDFDPATKQTKVRDALYYLDYAGGRLLATIPTYLQNASGTHVLGEFAVRDLVTDFQPPRGATPRFAMTVGQIGLGDGTAWAPLYVLETTTKKLGTYRVVPGAMLASGGQRPRFELVELKQLP